MRAAAQVIRRNPFSFRPNHPQRVLSPTVITSTHSLTVLPRRNATQVSVSPIRASSLSLFSLCIAKTPRARKRAILSLKTPCPSLVTSRDLFKRGTACDRHLLQVYAETTVNDNLIRDT